MREKRTLSDRPEPPKVGQVSHSIELARMSIHRVVTIGWAMIHRLVIV